MLHRFEIALADVDRAVYADLDLRVARHPSEDAPYLLTRVLAYALEHKQGLCFSKGLCDGEEPALWVKAPDGRIVEWIEVGAPAADRLHRAAKLAERVVVYAHRRPDLLVQRCAKERIHRGTEIRLVRVPAELLASLEAKLDRNNRWNVSVHEGLTTVVCGGDVFEHVFVSQPLVAEAG
ncbi:MAG TPA: YaeQ family protein [Planctomycetota bacterium]|nr:YaeQ family protein [Planctomycetota bacterium]